MRRPAPFVVACTALAALVAAPIASAADGEPAVAWAAQSTSPSPIDSSTMTDFEHEVLDRCGAGESGLRVAAASIVARKLRGEPVPDLDAIAFAQRAAGEPHPWARAWTASARSFTRSETLSKIDAWLAGDRSAGARRCGVASGTRDDGVRVLSVVAVEALADLSPLPTRARVGQWLTVEATLRVSARGARVLVMGPAGGPRSVPSSFDGRTVRARFAADGAGAFAVQVVADVAEGPRPVLEATVFADVEPPARFDLQAAPGEDAAAPDDDDETALAHMVLAARAAQGLSPIVRDPTLDAVARDHARRMAAAHELGHDLGRGDPAARVADAGIVAREVAENVAHAASVALTHRSIWSSPSHRANVLRAEMQRVGFGVVRDDRGDVWAVEELVRR
jgi:uncharacterized protein YkwD